MRFILSTGDSEILMKCGEIGIDFQIPSENIYKLSDGNIVNEINFINPEKIDKPSILIQIVYFALLFIYICGYLKIIFEKLQNNILITWNDKTNKQKSVLKLYSLLFGLFFMILFISVKMDLTFEVLILLVSIIYAFSHFINNRLQKYD